MAAFTASLPGRCKRRHEPCNVQQFLDGTKSAIEMTAIANACDLHAAAWSHVPAVPMSTTSRMCCGHAASAAYWMVMAWWRWFPA